MNYGDEVAPLKRQGKLYHGMLELVVGSDDAQQKKSPL